MKKVISDTRVPVKIWTTDIEEEAENQLRNVANLPFIFKHVAVMPDVHAGKGSTIGTVIATKGAIIPSCVGVDIGCGMAAVKLPFKVDVLGGSEKLRDLRHQIERSVPTGRYNNSNVTDRMATKFASLGDISEKAKPHVEGRVIKNSLNAMGSLGGGNHFIEICTDTNDDAWIMLHSGSRNIGKWLAELHINEAKNLMKSYFIDLPDQDLAYLVQDTPEFDAYIHDLLWGQRYAQNNRDEMLHRVVKDVSRHVYGDERLLTDFVAGNLFTVNCHHNYTQLENHYGNNVWVTRKGAVSAREGQYGIIPGSMGTRSYIVKGKGNMESFCSCSHGAGRKMSRTKARQLFTKEDLAQQTEGVECRKDGAVVDEIPASYKSIDEVMANQADLVDVVFELKQLICVKGGD